MTAGLGFDDWMGEVQCSMEGALGLLLEAEQVEPQELHTAMRYAVLDGGKRVRPLLVFAAGELFGAQERTLTRAAAAVELIHAYSLVHDDMPCMDNDALRRGKPTLHVRYGETMALLAGDALQAKAFETLAGGDGPPDAARRLEMLRVLAKASGSLGMCGGQAIDLASIGQSLSLDQLEQMHRLKTGSLLQAAVLLGALCGSQVEAGQRASLKAYSAAVGLAFQVVDDVLDATADSATLGKTAGKDAAHNKPTYVSILGLDQSRELAQSLRGEAYAALAPFGASAHRLREIADLIVQRKA
jgi:farnesyl diphosphate synthase